MSFGFSVGDFLTIGRLISDIVTSLRAASIAECRELILELHGLQRALHEIEHLKCTSSQEVAVNAIKVAALMCQYPLDDFSAKLNKFEGLEFNGGNKRSKLEIMRIWTRKLQWGFCMKEEVEKLRTYILVHVGSLNMRLITQGMYGLPWKDALTTRTRSSLKPNIALIFTILSSRIMRLCSINFLASLHGMLANSVGIHYNVNFDTEILYPN